MAKWLDRMLGIRSVDGVPQPWLEAFDQILHHIAESISGNGSPVAQAVRQFVLETGPDEVLSTLSGTPAIRAFLTAGYSSPEPVRRANRELVAGLPDVRPDIALRWLRLRAAVAPPYGGSASLGLPGGACWPSFLVGYDVLAAPGGKPYPMSFLEAVQVAAGWSPSTVLVAVLTARDPNYGEKRLVTAVLAAPELEQALLRHADAIRAAFGPRIGIEGLHFAQALTRVRPEAVSTFAPETAALLTSSSKRTRAAARPVLTEPLVAGPGPVREELLAVATAGETAGRVAALSLLHEAATAGGDAAFVERLEQLAGADKAVTVRRLVEEWTTARQVGEPGASDAGDDDASAGRPPAEMPQVQAPVIDWRVPVTTEVEAAVDDAWRWVAAQVERWNRQAASAPPGNYRARPSQMLDERTRRDLLEFLAQDRPLPRTPATWPVIAIPLAHTALRVAARGGAVAALKFLAFFGLRGDKAWGAFHVLGACGDVQDLLTVEALVRPVGVNAEAVLVRYCSKWNGFGAGWTDERVWPFFARHLDMVANLMRAEPSYGMDRSRLYAGIATLPVVPAPLVRQLFAIALGDGKTERAAAQKALARVPGKQARIVAGLADGKAEIRAAAARWLGELGDAGAVPALEAAYRKERQDVARAAILDSLETLGRPVEAYLDINALARDAAKGMAKPLPAAVAWLPWHALPTVRWAAGTEHAGRPVPDDLVRWLVVQAVKAKSAEPNALLRRYCGLWDAADRRALAQVLLETWLAHDVAPITADEARKRAEDEARMWHGWITRSPQRYQDHRWLGWSLDQITAAILPAASRIPAGSAIDSKGLLAVVAACGSGDVAAPVSRYLKEWFGHRTAQCKALLGMLAWVDHPAATALLLGVGNRFRTKGIQEEAARQAQAVAERHGWTVEELADRTIPTAGLDETGVLELDYGPRQFTAVLAPDLTLSLRSPDGKQIKSLPAPRSDDDADLAAAAKKTLAAAKKELAATVAQQSTRLYEAMCTGRAWPFEDWDRYLNRHPIVRHLLQRLVWIEVEPDPADPAQVRVLKVFRPLDDATLTDADDEPVTLPAHARIRLAHDAVLDDATVAAWKGHLADYEVAPPFGQLGAGFWRVPPARVKDTAIEEFTGHVLEAFALRGRAGKLGWTRGQAEDGGVFVTYRKRFPTLRLDAVLGFTGNTLPEENRTVALQELRFERVVEGANIWNAPTVALGEVPPVLLSECRNDVRLMAAEGPGYDPEWEKTTQW